MPFAMPADVPSDDPGSVRSITSAVLYTDATGAWLVGPDVSHLTKVTITGYSSITDSTFNYAAVDVESKGPGEGYQLYVSNADGVTISVDVNSDGTVKDYSALTQANIDSAEAKYGVDLNGNGGIGSKPVVANVGKDATLSIADNGSYMIGADATHQVVVTFNGSPLSANVLEKIAPGWTLNTGNANPAGGFDLYLSGPNGEHVDAKVGADGAVIGTSLLDQTAFKAIEQGANVSLDQPDLTAAPGWTSVLTDPYIKTAMEANLAANNQHLSYSQLESMIAGIIGNHQANGNAPISAAEFDSLKAIADRGNALFTATAQDGSDASSYLRYVFDQMINGSSANETWTGGTRTPVVLGNLAPGASLNTFTKLNGKWLLGTDLPTPETGGDAATGKVADTSATYVQATGTLFNGPISINNDIKQGSIGDCYFVAGVIDVANGQPDAIKAMIVDNGTVAGSHIWGVRFFDSNQKATWVTVNDQLPVLDPQSPSLPFGGDASKSTSGTLWFPLLEKAYAEVNSTGILNREAGSNGKDAYWAIEGGNPLAIQQITGRTPTFYHIGDPSTSSPNDQVVSQNDWATTMGSVIKSTLDSHHAVYLGSRSVLSDSYNNKEFVTSHAFAVLGIDLSNPADPVMTVRNPWGVANLPTPAGPTNDGFLSPFTADFVQLVGAHLANASTYFAVV